MPANVRQDGGLRVAGPLKNVTWYSVSSAYATAIYIGDPVVLTSTSNLVNVATAGTAGTIIGAVVGVYDSTKTPGCVDSNGVRVNYRPASVTGYVAVADDPSQLFVISGDGSGTLGLSAAGASTILASSAGSTVTGRSAWRLVETSAGTVANNQIRLVRPVDRANNDATVKDADWYCLINQHQKLQGIVGTAV